MLADLITRAVGSAGLKAAQYDPETGRLLTSRFGRGRKYRGRSIDEADALGLPPFWRGFTLICSAIAGTPVHAYRADRARLPKQPAWLTQPNPPEIRFDTMFRLVGSAILRGNGIAVLGFDRLGWPNVMVPADPRNVAAGRDPDGGIWYRIGNTVYDQTQVLHIRGPVIGDQIGGVGVIEAHRLGLSLVATLEEYAGSYFESGGTPSGVVEWGGATDPTEIDTFKREWVERFSGSLEPAVVPTGTKFTPIVGHADEAQLIEARTFSLTTSALILGLDPEWLGAPGSARTYQNLQGRDTSLMKWSLAPWFDRLDQAFSSNLMTPRPQYVRFNRDAVARSSQSERLAAYKLGLDMGLYTLAELRDWEDLPELDEPPAPPAPPALVAAPTEGTPDAAAQ